MKNLQREQKKTATTTHWSQSEINLKWKRNNDRNDESLNELHTIKSKRAGINLIIQPI